MKTQILIEGELVQIVLTPDDEFERNIVAMLLDKKARVGVHEGNFRMTKAEYYREFKSDKSIIIVVGEE